MAPERFNVMIIPEGSQKVRSLVVKRSSLKIFCCLTALFLIAVVGLAVDSVLTHLDREKLASLQIENASQREELQRLAVTLDEIRKEMVVLAQNDAKVRVMANLAKPKSDSLVGIGGPAEPDAGQNFSEVQRRIDEVRRQIDLRRESQEEIQGILNDQRSLLAAKPSGWPVKGWLTSSFGMRKDPFTGKRKMHEGLDIAARTGTTVVATADGIVSSVRTEAGYGKIVVVDHGYGYRTYYSHNSKIFVKVGQRVKRGERIAAVGNTGRSTGSHLHYEVRLNGAPVNPRTYL